ncbi:MAG TPA: hypothetical protein H9782_11490 [Candidatus Bariatricus faecipullorum]|nr:hypothetical protein [Candidatus Bariatricus faecipullorum]
MKLFDKLLKKSPEIPEQICKHNIYEKETSQYSPLPRFYYIKGEKYDIDSSSSVLNIPVCETNFKIGNEDWGIDTILREHVNRYYVHIPEDLKEACYAKISEIKWEGLEKLSRSEKSALKNQQEEQLQGKSLLNAISRSDMEQFHFEKYKMEEPFYDNNKCIMLISGENRNQVINDLSLLESHVETYCKSLCIKDNLHINPQELKFDISTHEKTNTALYFTYFECNPYTKTGKKAKFPLILHYATPAYYEFNPTINFFGDIYYLQDGNIGKARLIYWIHHIMYSFELGITRQTLEVKKVEKTINGNKSVLYNQ